MKNVRGYSMVLVLIVLGTLAMAITSFLSLTKGIVDTNAAIIQSRRVFLVADDLCRIVGAVAQDYFAEGEHTIIDAHCTGSANDRQRCDFERYLYAANRGGTDLVNFTMPGYTSSTTVQTVTPDTASPTRISGGPFAGMLGKQHRIDFNINATHGFTGATARCNQRVTLSPIGMFQFYVFSDIYLDFDPGGTVDARGRIHTNGDFCVAGRPRIDTVTSAGRFLISNPNTHGLCRRAATEANTIQVATNDSFSAFGTVTRDHTDPDWFNYARNTWGKRLQDSRHGVLTLRMPVRGTRSAQAGSNVLVMETQTYPATRSEAVPTNAAKEDNSQNLRFLVDPMLIAEGADAKAQKFAFKADIRIIDGVWFLRDPSHPEDLGTPIWSDHIGRGTTSYNGNQDAIVTNRMIGQDDIRADRRWSGTPQRFSYYPYRCDAGITECTAQRAVGSTLPAVVSYGTLTRLGTGSVAAPTAHPFYYRPGFMDGGVTLATKRATTPWALLRAARSGYKNGFMETRSEQNSGSAADGSGRTAEETLRARLLPINFDVAAFVQALQSCTAGSGELGTYFPGTCARDFTGSQRIFNGVVFVGGTWPGSAHGFGTTAAASDFAKLWPYQGNPVGDNNIGGGSTTVSVSQVDDNDTAMCGSGSTAVRVTTSNDHNLTLGEQFILEGINATYNGTYTVGQRVNRRVVCSVETDPGGTGDAAAASTGTVRRAVDDNLFAGAVPMPLCSPRTTTESAPTLKAPDATNLPTLPTPAANTNVLRKCHEYGRAGENNGSTASGTAAFPSVVRVVNALHINPPADRTYAEGTVPRGMLPRGLTIASNLPLALVGDVNIDTKPKKLKTDPLPADDWFVPFLVATDRFERLSVNWQDEFANWRDNMNVRSSARVGQETTQHNEILAGWNPTAPTSGSCGATHSADGFEDFPRYLESWTGRINFFGSIVIGFASVFERTGANNSANHGNGCEGGAGCSVSNRYVASFPSRNEGFDFHLEEPANQPPGSPSLNAQAVNLYLAE